MASEPLSVVARRRYDLAPERVFAAFTDPALLQRWFSPGVDVRMEVLAHDLRVGGRYRFRYTEQDGTVSVVAGAFCEITAPRRLVFTWSWEEPDPHAGIETLVTVEIADGAPGTEVTVTHERFPDEESRARHQQGWRTTLARMPAV